MAFEWYKKAAEQGQLGAQYELGKMYYYGDGILTDKNQAFYWMKKSAEGKKIGRAHYFLALLYYSGEGVEVDKKQAAYWMRKAFDNYTEEAKLKWDEYELWKYE